MGPSDSLRQIEDAGNPYRALRISGETKKAPPRSRRDMERAGMDQLHYVMKAASEGNSHVPEAAILQFGMEQVDPEIRELVASAYRPCILKVLQMREKFGIGPGLEENEVWIRECGDKTSFTMQATRADLLMAMGNEEEAREVYMNALRLAREQGQMVME